MKKILKLLLLTIFAVTSANAVMWSGYAKFAKQQVYRLNTVAGNLFIQQNTNPQLYFNNFDASKKTIKDLSTKIELTKFIGSDVMHGAGNIPFSYTPLADTNQFKICNVLGVDNLTKDSEKKQFVIKMFKNSTALRVTGKYDAKTDCYTIYDDSKYSAWLTKSKTPYKPSDSVDGSNCLTKMYQSKTALDAIPTLSYETGTCAYVKNGSDKVDTYYYNKSDKQWYLWNVGDGGLTKEQIIALIKKYGGTTVDKNKPEWKMRMVAYTPTRYATENSGMSPNTWYNRWVPTPGDYLPHYYMFLGSKVYEPSFLPTKTFYALLYPRSYKSSLDPDSNTYQTKLAAIPQGVALMNIDHTYHIGSAEGGSDYTNHVFVLGIDYNDNTHKYFIRAYAANNKGEFVYNQIIVPDMFKSNKITFGAGQNFGTYGSQLNNTYGFSKWIYSTDSSGERYGTLCLQAEGSKPTCLKYHFIKAGGATTPTPKGYTVSLLSNEFDTPHSYNNNLAGLQGYWSQGNGVVTTLNISPSKPSKKIARLRYQLELQGDGMGTSDDVDNIISLKYNSTTKKYEAIFSFSDPMGVSKKTKTCTISNIFQSESQSCKTGLGFFSTNAYFQGNITYTFSDDTGKFCFNKYVAPMNAFAQYHVKKECVTYKYTPSY